jgi:hypothetical protein
VPANDLQRLGAGIHLGARIATAYIMRAHQLFQLLAEVARRLVGAVEPRRGGDVLVSLEF